MKIKQYISLFVVLGSLLLLAACGSSGGSGGDQTASPADNLGSDVTTGIDYVGADNCIGCHEGFSWSSEIVERYLSGAHVIHSSHITQADEADGCLNCHDPIGDGPRLERLIAAANVPAEDLAAVGCENCHGAGGDHYGVGPMPVARPDAASCGSCHSELEPSHLVYHPEANTITADYLSSPHARSINEHSYVDGSESDVRASCSKCHTDEGGKLYKHIQSNSEVIHSLDGNPAVANATPVQCRTCHDAHNPQELLLGDIEDGDGKVVESAEYRTCTNCHQQETAYHDPATNPYGNLGEIITDTHFLKIDDNETPADVSDDTVEVEGYNIDPANERACRDCHNIHSVEMTILKQWTTSGHGDATSEAWVHYDWDASDRQSCQECHTSTGAKNYLNDPASFDATANDFSHLSGWSVDGDGVVTSSSQNELLYCWGCHSDNSGGLRNPGAVSLSYTVDGVNPTLPELGNSNLCANCHNGRGNMDSYVANDAADPTTGMTALSPGFGPGTKNVTSAHYLVASATLFQSQTRVGYEYPVVDGDGNPVDPYADVPYFVHNAISLNSDAPETGNGPCAACHMETDESHTFNVVEKDAGGVITALKSTRCVECHSGAYGVALVVEDTTIDGTLHTAVAAAAFLEHEAEGFHGALELLESELLAKGLTFTGDYPYFTGASWIDEGTFGAAHNYNYLHHEPGAYAHNRIYAKRSIFDSIDWLQNSALTGTIDVSNATTEGAVWLGTSRP